MRRLAPIAALALLLAACPKKDTTPTPEVVVPTDEVTDTFFWRIDGPNGPSYLLGTMHIGVDPEEVLPTGIWEKFDDSKTFVLEVDTTGPETLGLGMQPPERSLDDDLTPEQWDIVVTSLGLDPEVAEGLKELQVWMLVVQLQLELAPPTRSIDDVLHIRANNQNKDMAFLESIKEQSAVLERFMDVEYLLYFVQNLDAQRKSLEKSAEIFRSGDIDRLYESSIVGMGKHIGEDGLEILLFERNRKWIPELEQHIANGGAFVAVGASHLIGDRGVVQLLRDAGYTVTRIRE